MVLTPWAIDKEHLKQGEKIGTVSIDTGTVRISVWVQNRDGIDEQQCKEAMDTAHLVSQIPAMIQYLRICKDSAASLELLGGLAVFFRLIWY